MDHKAESDTENVSPPTDPTLHEDATWGPWLFRSTMVATLIFMWWLVIYDHGVLAHH